VARVCGDGATIRGLKHAFDGLMENIAGVCAALCPSETKQEIFFNGTEQPLTSKISRGLKRCLPERSSCLKMIARDESLALILDALCRLVEDLSSGSLSVDSIVREWEPAAARSSA